MNWLMGTGSIGRIRKIKNMITCENKDMLLMSGKTRVVFICTANAARSQMAEGLLRAKYGNRFEVYSAGTRPSRVSFRAIQVMQEIGIDISRHHSKTLNEISGITFDLAVTLCDNVHRICPVILSAKKTIHQGFQDPHLTPGGDEAVLEGYRNVRDRIATWIDTAFGEKNTDFNRFLTQKD
jgi:arsenate reductase (thioredoxin)